MGGGGGGGFVFLLPPASSFPSKERSLDFSITKQHVVVVVPFSLIYSPSPCLGRPCTRMGVCVCGVADEEAGGDALRVVTVRHPRRTR